MNKKIVVAASVVAVIVGIIAALYFLSAIKPDRPKIVSSPLLLDPYESSLDVPVSVSVERIKQILESSVPPTFAGSDRPNVPGNFDRETLNYRLQRTPLEVSATDGVLRLTTSVSGTGTLQARHCPGGEMLPCHSIRETGVVAATVIIALSDIRISEDWKLHATFVPTVNVTKAEIRIIGNMIPVSLRSVATDAIKNSIPAVQSAFGDLLSQLDLRGELAKTWEKMDHIVRVYDSPETWIVVKPSAIGVAPVQIANGQLSSAVKLVATIKTVIGSKPVDAKSPIPQKPSSSGDAHFEIRIPVLVSMDTISDELNDCCMPIELPIEELTTITFKDVELMEGNGRVIISARFSTGLFKEHGRMYFEGTPYITDDRNTLRVRNLDFDVRTRQALLEGAAELLKPVILDELTEHLQLDLSTHYKKAVDLAKEQGSDITFGAGVRVQANVRKVSIENVSFGDSTVAIVAAAEGSAVVSLP